MQAKLKFQVSLLCAGACHVFAPPSLAANPEFEICQHLISEVQFLQIPAWGECCLFHTWVFRSCNALACSPYCHFCVVTPERHSIHPGFSKHKLSSPTRFCLYHAARNDLPDHDLMIFVCSAEPTPAYVPECLKWASLGIEVHLEARLLSMLLGSGQKTQKLQLLKQWRHNAVRE